MCVCVCVWASAHMCVSKDVICLIYENIIKTHMKQN